jgi:hypothetical protein
MGRPKGDSPGQVAGAIPNGHHAHPETEVLKPGSQAHVNDPIDVDRAESIVLQAYVQLPLLPRQADGSWIAALKTFPDCELQLVEKVSEPPDHSVLRVELLDRSTQSVVKVESCDEVEDAVAAFVAMLPLARSYADFASPTDTHEIS